MPNLITQRTETAPIDEQTCRATFTLQWLLERKEDIAHHPITAYNDIRVLVCGEEGFGQIAADLEAARESIEIACWGFDPGMELRREGDHWPRGETLGGLLERKAQEGVQVRLLAWYDRMGSRKQSNLIGYSDRWRHKVSDPREREPKVYWNADGSASIGPTGVNPYTDRSDHCVSWWERALRGQIPHLEVRLRAGDDDSVKASLASADIDAQDRPSMAAPGNFPILNEQRLHEWFGTHHQKSILIDYARGSGRAAIGYVMGLNSLTDYWDSTQHHFNDPRREVDWKGGALPLTAFKSALGKALDGTRFVSRDPYQDYAARLRGQVLEQVERNFSTAWRRTKPESRPLPPLARSVPPKLARPGAGRRIQIVRTQPEEGDRTIQRAYWQATRSARSYIYIENQYFYYEAWARHLKAMRREFMRGVQRAGVGKSDAGLLHAFVVIPWPEDDGMVPRTYDTVKSLGQASSLPGQDGALKAEADRYAANRAEYERRLAQWLQNGRLGMSPPAPQYPEILRSAQQVQAPVKNADGELGESVPAGAGRAMRFEGLGLKVLLARMVSFNDPGHEGYVPGLRPEQNYRQVYIHSKLAMADDCWFTLGSANLNVRSMAADSEINVNVEDGTVATELRRRVWGLMTGQRHDGGGGTPKEVALAFEGWKKLMEVNASSYERGVSPISGFLIPFSDERVVMFRHG
jgi:phosphatidylserine/phosphatidylglycerophosphate/cardiolipin synthase-like enzyme